MSKKIIIVLLILILTVCLFILFRTIKSDKTTQTTQPNNTANTTTGIANPASVYCVEQGGRLSIRKDTSGGEYGVCVFKDGSECEEWKFFRKECPASGPVDGPIIDLETDQNLIEQALVREEGINLNQVDVVVSKDTGKYASGGIRPKQNDVGGAYFFAAKTTGGWTIVAAGNGTISCSDTAPYPDLPTDMIPECIDASGNPVQR